MAGLANPPGFGNNPFIEDNWSHAQAAFGPRFLVGGASSWAPTVNVSATRTINIAPGGGWHCGVWDETLATETITFTANAGSSDRWDALVSRADYTANTRTFAVIAGTTVPPAVNTTTSLNAAQINRIAGTRYDGLIGFVRVRPGVTTFAASDLIDLRVWSNGSGLLSTPTENAYLDRLDVAKGGLLAIDSNGKILRRDTSSTPSTFTNIAYTPQSYLTGGATGTIETVTTNVMSISVPDPGFPYKLVVAGCVLITVLGSDVVVYAEARVDGSPLNPRGANVGPGGSGVLAALPTPAMSTTRTGAATVTLTIVKASGSAGNGYGTASSSVYNLLSVQVIPG